MNFNKSQCLSLLKKRKNLWKEGKSLRNFNKFESDKLLEYLTLIEDQVFWQSRKNYYETLDSFINKKISLDEFFKQFYNLWGSNLKLSRTLINNLEKEAYSQVTKSNEIGIELDSKSKGFTAIISSFHSWVELCNPEITLEINLERPDLIGYGISEELLRSPVAEDCLSKLKKYLNEKVTKSESDN